MDGHVHVHLLEVARFLGDGEPHLFLLAVGVARQVFALRHHRAVLLGVVEGQLIFAVMPDESVELAWDVGRQRGQREEDLVAAVATVRVVVAVHRAVAHVFAACGLADGAVLD